MQDQSTQSVSTLSKATVNLAQVLEGKTGAQFCALGFDHMLDALAAPEENVPPSEG